jgi:hypothetical protein
MKKYLTLLLVLTMAISCKKDKNEKPVQAPTGPGLVGKWELTQEIGNFAPNNVYPAGNGNTFQFNADSTFIQYTSFQLTNQGAYSVVEQTAGMPQFKFLVLYLNHKLYNGISLRTDTLVIGNSASDAPAYIYVRRQ